MNLLFYCQRSAGMGHLMRSRALSEALGGRFNVTFVSGGVIPQGMRMPPGVSVVQLPPVGMDADGHLVSRDRRRTVDHALVERRRMFLETYRTRRPRVIVIDLFPFGRRRFLPELEPVLEEARQGAHGEALVFCSLRDILVSRRRPDHDARVPELLARYFDGVLVHSDPSFAKLEETFTDAIQKRLPVLYTGFVRGGGAAVARRSPVRPGSIVVSVGAGHVGETLLRCAVDAYALIPPPVRLPLTLLAGPLLPRAAWRALRAVTRNRPGIELHRWVADLASTLKTAAASISQCGYNTAIDLLDSRVPALVLPFGEGSEDEQLKRARRLEALGLVRVLLPKDLTAGRLAEEMSGLPRFQPPAAGLSMDGTTRTAALLSRFAQASIVRPGVR